MNEKEKNMKKFIALMLAISLCLSLGATVIAVDSGTMTPLSEEMQIKECIAVDKYNVLLKYWAYDPEHIDDFNANYPYFYGGAYINDNKDLVIQVTSSIDEARKYFSEIIDIENISFENVQFSFADLKEQHKIITDKMGSYDVFVSSISGVGLSIPENSVVLYVNTNERGSEAEEFITSVRKNVSDFSNVKVVITSGMDTPCAAVEPGSLLLNVASGAWLGRSAGFWAYDSSNKLGIVTAPHATLSSGTTLYAATSSGSSSFGTAGTPYFGGSVDAVFIERTNTSFTPTRSVPGHGFNTYSGANVILPSGATTYSRGQASLHQTGIVQDTAYTTSYGISNCTLTSAPSASGDSGGIVAGSGNTSTRYIAGIITGIQGGTNYQIYVKASNILSTLSLTIY